jgi:hypothetical protein
MLHRKRVTMAVTFVFLAMVMCAPAAFGQTVVTDAPILDQSIFNECNGEWVTLNGTMHGEMSFSANPNGMTHMSLNATEHMTGVGQTTGVNYVANDSQHLETNTRGFAQEQTNNTKIKLISQGPQTPNMMDHATLHVVIDKNNNVKVEISKHQIKCN